MRRIRRAVLLVCALAATAAGLTVGTEPVGAQGGLGGSGCTTETHMVDCFRVSAVTLAPVQSVQLPKGVYRVVSTGTWQNLVNGASVLVDAECVDSATGFVRNDAAGPDRLDLQVNGTAPTWVPSTPTIAGCNPTGKKFETYVHVPQPGSLTMAIDDPDPTGNLGSLEVKIFNASAELGLDLQGVAGIAMIDPSKNEFVGVPASKWTTSAVMVRGVYQWSPEPQQLADAECATIDGSTWSPMPFTGNLVYEDYWHSDYLDVLVDGFDQHLDPVRRESSTDYCDEQLHAYLHSGDQTPPTMLVESDKVRFKVYDRHSEYWDNKGVLFAIVLPVALPTNPNKVNPPVLAPPLLGYADAATVGGTVQPPVGVTPGQTTTTGALTGGVYELTATGVWHSGNLEVDAECTSQQLKNEFDRDRPASGPTELGNGDLRVNGQLTEWLPATPDGTGCAPTHTYHTYVTVPAGGGSLSLDIEDPDDAAGNPWGNEQLTVAFKRVATARVNGVHRTVTASGAPIAVYGDNPATASLPLAGAGENLVVSEGTFRYRHFNEADAECSYAKPRAWTAEQGGVDNPDLVIGGVERLWAPTTTTGDGGNEIECPMGRHERWVTVNAASAGETLTALIQDAGRQDNDGALVVTAFLLA